MLSRNTFSLNCFLVTEKVTINLEPNKCFLWKLAVLSTYDHHWSINFSFHLGVYFMPLQHPMIVKKHFPQLCRRCPWFLSYFLHLVVSMHSIFAWSCFAEVTFWIKKYQFLKYSNLSLSIHSRKLESLPPEAATGKHVLKNFAISTRKTPVLESLFNKVAGL